MLYLKALIGEIAVAIATLPAPNVYMVGRQRERMPTLDLLFRQYVFRMAMAE